MEIKDQEKAEAICIMPYTLANKERIYGVIACLDQGYNSPYEITCFFTPEEFKSAKTIKDRFAKYGWKPTKEDLFNIVSIVANNDLLSKPVILFDEYLEQPYVDLISDRISEIKGFFGKLEDVWVGWKR